MNEMGGKNLNHNDVEAITTHGLKHSISGTLKFGVPPPLSFLIYSL